MSERIKQIMTSTFGEDGVRFVENREALPDMTLMDSLIPLARIEDLRGNLRYMLKLMDVKLDFGSAIGNVQSLLDRMGIEYDLCGSVGNVQELIQMLGVEANFRSNSTPMLDYEDTPDTTGDVETIFVPGYASRNCTFRRFRAVLAENGISSRLLRDFEELRFRTPLSAYEAAPILQREIEKSTADRVRLLCHSMGSVTAAIGCNGLSPRDLDRVEIVVALGPPWHGSPLAPVLRKVKRGDKALRDLSSGSDILTKELPRVKAQVREKIVSVGSKNDCISPEQSSFFEGALVNAVICNDEAPTHADMLHDRRIAQSTADIFNIAA